MLASGLHELLRFPFGGLDQRQDLVDRVLAQPELARMGGFAPDRDPVTHRAFAGGHDIQRGAFHHDGGVRADFRGDHAVDSGESCFLIAGRQQLDPAGQGTFFEFEQREHGRAETAFVIDRTEAGISAVAAFLQPERLLHAGGPDRIHVRPEEQSLRVRQLAADCEQQIRVTVFGLDPADGDPVPFGPLLQKFCEPVFPADRRIGIAVRIHAGDHHQLRQQGDSIVFIHDRIVSSF